MLKLDTALSDVRKAERDEGKVGGNWILDGIKSVCHYVTIL